MLVGKNYPEKAGSHKVQVKRREDNGDETRDSGEARTPSKPAANASTSFIGRIYALLERHFAPKFCIARDSLIGNSTSCRRHIRHSYKNPAGIQISIPLTAVMASSNRARPLPTAAAVSASRNSGMATSLPNVFRSSDTSSM